MAIVIESLPEEAVVVFHIDGTINKETLLYVCTSSNYGFAHRIVDAQYVAGNPEAIVEGLSAVEQSLANTGINPHLNVSFVSTPEIARECADAGLACFQRLDAAIANARTAMTMAAQPA